MGSPDHEKRWNIRKTFIIKLWTSEAEVHSIAESWSNCFKISQNFLIAVRSFNDHIISDKCDPICSSFEGCGSSGIPYLAYRNMVVGCSCRISYAQHLLKAIRQSTCIVKAQTDIIISISWYYKSHELVDHLQVVEPMTVFLSMFHSYDEN